MSILIGTMNPNIRTYTYKNADGTVAGSIGVTRARDIRNIKKLKKLQYNFKEISAMILRAKTSGSARQTVTMARCRTAMLRRKLRTGEYDEKELESAIIHAEQMERVARKRMKHLQAEERAERENRDTAEEENLDIEALESENAGKRECSENTGNTDAADALKAASDVPDSAELERLLEKMRRLMESSMEKLETDMSGSGGLDELLEETLGGFEDIEPEDLELRKKKHRADELREIVEADMKYLKAMFDRLESEKAGAADGVTLELGGAGVMAQPQNVMTGQPVVAASAVPVSAEGCSVDVSV